MSRPVDYVDPLIDTANRRFFYFNSASRPFGMVNLSPDTRVGENAWRSGYRHQDQYVHWFSHLHAWQLCALPVMPTLGDFIGHHGSEHYKSAFSHDKETVKPGYHAVYLERYGIHAELTCSPRVGFHRYRFDRADTAWIVFDLGAEIMLPMSDAMAKIHDARSINGFVENERTMRRPKRVKIFYHSKFNREYEEIKSWRDGELVDFDHRLSGPAIGVAFKFNVEAGDELLMKMAISYCSSANALKNMEQEIPHWDFDLIHQEASEDWNTQLSRITVEGGSESQRIKFYTDVFHALKGRRRVSDVDGSYLDNTGELPRVRQIPLDNEGQPQYNHHNSDAFWGTPWTLNLFWALAWPEVTNSFCNTMIDMYKNGGLIPRGPSGGDYTYVMTAATSTPFLVSAWMQGIRNFDIGTAYEGMLKNHSTEGLMAKAGYEHDTFIGGGAKEYLERGYVPQGLKADAMHVEGAATMTLEYAYHDWSLAQLAKALGKEDDYQTLMKRALNYHHHWDPETKYMRPREMNGQFSPDFDPMSPYGWEEGNGYHYRWFAPHDVSGLIELFGGRDIFIKELNSLFELAEETGFIAPHGYHYKAPMDYGNQPCMYLAHLFIYAGAPWLSQKWIRRVIDTAKSDITPQGGYSGDEDQGQMGCLNALMSIGLFNVSGACDLEPYYEISAPLFDKVTIKMDDQVFNIEAINNGPGAIYIQSAELNGQACNKAWLPRQAVTSGGTLKLYMGKKPNKTWGAAREDAPPSLSD